MFVSLVSCNMNSNKSDQTNNFTVNASDAIYNINQDERGRQSGISLKTQSEFNATNPSQQERDFYNKYLEITGKYRDLLGKDGMGEFYIPHVQMGNVEALSARGLLGLYANYLGSTTNIDSVMVKGTGADGKATNMTFGEFKELYLTEGGELTMKSGRRIYELRKLKKQAELKALEAEYNRTRAASQSNDFFQKDS